jgi:hypothetical protein
MQRRAAPARLPIYFFGAAAAGHGLEDLYLFAVVADDQMPDVDDALVAGVGALQASVVRL